MRKKNYVFVTGGVVSSLGKGITTAALGTILEARGLSLRFLKLDPYLNIDPGTLSPYQHGEVFVTEDGTETDLDLGHYERFTHVKTTQDDHYTAGKIYASVLRQERQGKYSGDTVQIIPHVTDEIKQVIQSSGSETDITLVEIGGTVGDIESLPFLEAIRQIRIALGETHTYFIHLTLVPYLNTSGETKTKPTQHSNKELRSIGIQPDMLICRGSQPLPKSARDKIALFSNLALPCVISLPDVETIYQIPLLLLQQQVDTHITKKLQLPTSVPDLTAWKNILSIQKDIKNEVNIGIIGKYTKLTDSYKSISEALIHAGIHTHTYINIHYIDAEKVDIKQLNAVDAILVPGGFGPRGIEGKILASRYAREHTVPYLGICLGMQVAIIDIARHCAHLTTAHSTEFNMETAYPVIALVTEWKNKKGQTETRNHQSLIGGTMRLGSQSCYLSKDSQIAQIYKNNHIMERHRHRYEVNHQWADVLSTVGLKITGRSSEGLIETIELDHHPWFIGCQFHPEFTSTPQKGHPLFISFIEAAKAHKGQKTFS